MPLFVIGRIVGKWVGIFAAKTTVGADLPIGYADYRGGLDVCIAIRTIVLEAGQATLQAGAGIVADSDPEAEERETEAKAGALFEALRLAGELSAPRAAEGD